MTILSCDRLTKEHDSNILRGVRERVMKLLLLLLVSIIAFTFVYKVLLYNNWDMAIEHGIIMGGGFTLLMAVGICLV